MSKITNVPIDEINKTYHKPNYDEQCRAYKNEDWMIADVPFFSGNGYMIFHLYSSNGEYRYGTYAYHKKRGILPVSCGNPFDDRECIETNKSTKWFVVEEPNNSHISTEVMMNDVYKEFKDVLELDLAEMLLY